MKALAVGKALLRAYCNSLIWFTVGVAVGGTYVGLFIEIHGGCR